MRNNYNSTSYNSALTSDKKCLSSLTRSVGFDLIVNKLCNFQANAHDFLSSLANQNASIALAFQTSNKIRARVNHFT
jgi:hypothetical protein